MVVQCLNFFQHVDSNGQILKSLTCLNKYTGNSSIGCVFEVDLEYSKELRELNNEYLLSPNKIEIKREMLSDYQLKISNLRNIHIGNVKKLVPNFFDKKSAIFLENRIKTKKIHQNKVICHTKYLTII